MCGQYLRIALSEAEDNTWVFIQIHRKGTGGIVHGKSRIHIDPVHKGQVVK
jgi:hypothetical protein